MKRWPQAATYESGDRSPHSKENRKDRDHHESEPVFYFAPSGLGNLRSTPSRGDALSRMPLAILFRAFSARTQHETNLHFARLVVNWTLGHLVHIPGCGRRKPDCR